VPKKTLILIPACNEEERIGTVLAAVAAQAPTAEILVIDDGSQDGTAAEARRRGAGTICHPFNLGYGAALHTGYLYARRHGYDQVVQLDADGQHDPRSLGAILDALDQGADVVVGSRYLLGDAPRTSWLRKVASRMFAWIVTTWTGVKITDPTSGYQGLSRQALDEVAGDAFPEDYPDADVLIMLHRAGLKLAEIPVVMHERKGGISMHRGGKVAYYAYKMFLTLALIPVRRPSPFRAGRVAPAAVKG
jgi:glycosyltransferase involved in cell wall biosynthesis